MRVGSIATCLIVWLSLFLPVGPAAIADETHTPSNAEQEARISQLRLENEELRKRPLTPFEQSFATIGGAIQTAEPLLVLMIFVMAFVALLSFLLTPKRKSADLNLQEIQKDLMEKASQIIDATQAEGKATRDYLEGTIESLDPREYLGSFRSELVEELVKKTKEDEAEFKKNIEDMLSRYRPEGLTEEQLKQFSQLMEQMNSGIAKHFEQLRREMEECATSFVTGVVKGIS